MYVYVHFTPCLSYEYHVYRYLDRMKVKDTKTRFIIYMRIRGKFLETNEYKMSIACPLNIYILICCQAN